MSFYDDLGVQRGATTDEVREQYRVIARLLHPDRFADHTLKCAAEKQMQRFNEIEAILTNPEQRRRYDAALARQANGTGETQIIIHAPQPVRPERPLPWNSLAWGAALMACAAAIVWVSNHEEETVLPQVEARGEEWRLRAQSAIEERDQALRELARVRADWTRRFTGLWKNARREPADQIETQIIERNGQISGEYRSPLVKFAFTGRAAGASAKMPFVRDDGARGEVNLQLISEHEMKIVWTAASESLPTASSGTALLVRDQ